MRREFQGTLLVREDDQGRITEKEHNPAGLISEETIHGRRTSYFYDQHDRLVRTDHYEDSTSYISEEQKYDALDRIIEHSRSHSNGTLLSRTQSDYDSLGNLVRQRKWIDPTTIANTYQQFNALSELISSTDPLGLVTTYCVSNHNEGKRTDTRDPLGRVTRVQYDPASRPVLSQRFDANDALIAESWVKYDGRGHKTEQTDIRFDSTQPIDKYRVHWTYDARGRLIELAEPDRVYTYTYDSVGRLLTTTKPDGTVLTKAYSASGDLVSQRSSDGSIDVVYTYDDRQRLMRICDRTTQLTVTRAYSIHDEIVQESQGPHLQTYTYDALGRCLVHTLPDGSEVHRSYRNGRLHSVRRGTWVHSLDQIDFCGHPLQSTLAGKAGKLFQTWDIQERPTSMLSNSYVVSNVRYNPVELLTGYFCKGPGGSFDFSASYDSWDQLCEERGRLTARYTLDSLGNRIQRDDQACSIGPSNQLLTCGDTDYTYDANGNRLTDGRFHYTYDALDRLVKVDTPTGTVTYRYDGLGRRLFRNDQRFLWSDECEIGSISHDGTLTSLRILASDVHLEVGSAVLVEINGTTFVPIHDLHGNCVVLMEAETGKVSGFANYSAYGEHTSSGTLGPWRFSSKRFDAVTGLHHFGGRDYDAAIGRWLTPDPMGFVDGPNLYAYVHNNPLTSIDSTGYCLDSFSDNTDYYLQRHWNETYRDNPIALARQQRAAGDMAARMFAGNTYDAITVGSSGAQLRKAIASDLAMLVPGGTAIAAFRVAKFCRAAQQISSVGHSTALTRRQLVATRFSTTVSPKVYCQSAAIDSVLANRGILSVRTKNLLPLKLDARALIRAGSEADRGGLTKAGRGLQKHGGRPGSIFTAPKGPVTVVNQTGIDRLHDIVSHSFRTTSFKELQRYGRVIDMHSPGLGGARFGGNGNFIGFLEP